MTKPESNDLLSRLDRVGVHQSVAARYCKEAAERIRQLESAISWALGEGDSDFGDNKPENAPAFYWREELRERAGR